MYKTIDDIIAELPAERKGGYLSLQFLGREWLAGYCFHEVCYEEGRGKTALEALTKLREVAEKNELG